MYIHTEYLSGEKKIDSLRVVFFKLECYQSYLEGSLKFRLLGPIPEFQMQ